MKKVWYISHYIAPPDLDTHSRAIKFSKYLKDYGFDVTIFCSSYLHNKNRDIIASGSKYIEREYDGVKFVHVKSIPYGSSKLLRIISLIHFSIRIFILKKKFERPDIILHTAQIPFENLISFTARKLRCLYVVEVLDLWPESFVAYGLIKKHNPLLKLLYQMEKSVYARADRIIFSMEGGRDYIIEKKWDKLNGGPIDLKKVFYINNGLDFTEFEENKNKFRLQDPDLDDENMIRVTYVGSIRLANNLKQLIDAALLLRNYTQIRFLLWGDGDERAALQDYCKKLALENVIFKEKWVALKYIPYILSKSSVNIINYMQTDILRYGGSQGKLFQYLASGKPICSNPKMGYCLIDKYSIGISGNINNARDYADAITHLARLDKSEYSAISERAREAAREFDWQALAQKLSQALS